MYLTLSSTNPHHTTHKTSVMIAVILSIRVNFVLLELCLIHAVDTNSMNPSSVLWLTKTLEISSNPPNTLTI